ncbi:MAG TPA: hypothetical protein VEF91_03915 [Verrucomicrobiae bacterium]|nr:hypothetical protein [Verrucomicrobiae bacterium]
MKETLSEYPSSFTKTEEVKMILTRRVEPVAQKTRVSPDCVR